MIDLLELPEFRHRVSPLTVAEYHRLGEFDDRGRRTELIRGMVLQKMSKSPLHSALSARLYEIFRSQLPSTHCLRKEEPLTFTDSEPEPDLAIVAGSNEDFQSSHPITAELVVEVSVSSLAEDRAKAAIYAEAGVREYWIVMAKEQQVEIYRNPAAGLFAERLLLDEGKTLVCASLPISVRLGDLFC